MSGSLISGFDMWKNKNVTVPQQQLRAMIMSRGEEPIETEDQKVLLKQWEAVCNMEVWEPSCEWCNETDELELQDIKERMQNENIDVEEVIRRMRSEFELTISNTSVKLSEDALIAFKEQNV